jgi:organic hydroperoxide reductase OsmC/OhrA
VTSYKTWASWKGEHWGRLKLSNGPEMDFSAPPTLKGHPDVLTPEDAFVGALNTCFQMMFLWAAERFGLDLVSYECEAEGFVHEYLDQTSWMARVVLRPSILVRNSTEARVRLALKAARRYSLVAESVKSEVVIEPVIMLAQ